MRSFMEAPLGAAIFQSPIAQPNADGRGLQHMHASLYDKGRVASFFDTGAASRGSGNTGTNKK